jgi:hypothetical protein
VPAAGQLHQPERIAEQLTQHDDHVEFGSPVEYVAERERLCPFVALDGTPVEQPLDARTRRSAGESPAGAGRTTRREQPGASIHACAC